MVSVALLIVGTSWALRFIAQSRLSGKGMFPEVRVPSRIRDNMAKTKMLHEHELDK